MTELIHDEKFRQTILADKSVTGKEARKIAMVSGGERLCGSLDDRTARRARNELIDASNKFYEADFCKLKKFGRDFIQKNKGSVFKLEEKEGRFHRLFVGVQSVLDVALKVGLKYTAADATHGRHVLHKCGMYIILSTKDTNNHLIPIAWCCVDGETKEAYEWFAIQLREWGAGEYLEHAVLMSDQDKGLDALHQAFPEAYKLLCFFHLMKNMCKHSRIRVQKSHKAMAWEMQRARTKDDYIKCYKKFRKVNKHAADYLHGKKHEEVFFYAYNKKGIATFDNSTNNTVEGLNGTFKAQRAELPLWFNIGLLEWIGKEFEKRTLEIEAFIKKGNYLTPFAQNHFDMQVNAQTCPHMSMPRRAHTCPCMPRRAHTCPCPDVPTHVHAQTCPHMFMHAHAQMCPHMSMTRRVHTCPHVLTRGLPPCVCRCLLHSIKATITLQEVMVSIGCWIIYEERRWR